MSKYITLLTILFLSCEGSFRPEKYSENFTSMSYITITSPNGGENWEMGTIDTISWSYNNLVESPIFSIALYQDGDFLSDIITQPASPDFLAEYVDDVTGARWKAVYGWLIPISLSDSNNYKIRISSFDSIGNLVVGESNDHFTLTASDILMPDFSYGSGCENWQDAIVVSTSPSDFTSDGISEPFPEGNYYINSVIQNIGSADAVYPANETIWEVYLDNAEISSWGYSEGGTITSSSCVYANDDNTNYLSAGTHELKIVADPDNNIVEFDENNNTYTRTIDVGSFITVTAPNGGESWETGSTQTITWGSSGLARLSSGGSSMVKNEKKKKYNIKKDKSIKIGRAAQSLTKQLTKNSSLGRTKVSKDTKQVSMPASFSRNSNVKIELYSDGSLYEVIANSTDNSGSYSWMIPSTYDAGSTYKVRISDVSSTAVFDESDGSFTLIEPTPIDGYIITSPNGGEAWNEGSTQTITWEILGEYLTSCAYNSCKVYLYYSLNGGESWIEVGHIPYDGASGEYDWTIPTVYITNPHCLLKVVGSSYYGTCYNSCDHSSFPDYHDISDAEFTITASGGSSLITIQSPNGGESWHEGDTETITWSTNGDIGGNTVKIDYSANAGIGWTSVVSSTSNSGSYNWTVPSRSDTNTIALVRIASASNTDLYDASDNYFTMTSDSNYYRILSPNGGEELHMGSSRSIFWESGGDVGAVKLYYSEYSGDSWYSIDDNESNDGSYTWTVPTLQSDNANILVKIVDRSNEAWFDISDATFSIKQTVTETFDMDFESGESTSGWTFGGGWAMNSSDAYSGSGSVYCYGPANDTLSTTHIATNPGLFRFYYKASFYAGSSYSNFRLNIDGIQKFIAHAGMETSSWQIVEVFVDSGTHTYEWIHDGYYSSSTSYYNMIDAISFPEGSASSNSAPTDISLSSSSVAENESYGTTVGTLSTTDADAGDSHTYTLVSGTGSTDNSSFTISGSSLKTAASFDYETKSSYSIRIQTEDSGGATYEESFIITVTDVEETASTCDYTISLHDSYGDGWHGNNHVNLYIDGSLVNTYTMSSGSSLETESFTVSYGSSIHTTFTSGSYTAECYYYIYDSIGDQVASDGCGGNSCAPSGVSAFSASCPGSSTDSCLGVSCDDYCSGNTAYYNGSCSNGSCSYSSQYCSYGCSNGSCDSDACSGVSCSSYCSGNTAYYNGSCSNGNCSYSSQYCSAGCSNGSCNSETSSADCSNAYYCSDCYGCSSSCCPSYCSGNYYYYNRSCSGGFCVGSTSTYCSNGCSSSGCN